VAGAPSPSPIRPFLRAAVDPTAEDGEQRLHGEGTAALVSRAPPLREAAREHGAPRAIKPLSPSRRRQAVTAAGSPSNEVPLQWWLRPASRPCWGELSLPPQSSCCCKRKWSLHPHRWWPPTTAAGSAAIRLLFFSRIFQQQVQVQVQVLVYCLDLSAPVLGSSWCVVAGFFDGQQQNNLCLANSPVVSSSSAVFQRSKSGFFSLFCAAICRDLSLQVTTAVVSSAFSETCSIYSLVQIIVLDANISTQSGSPLTTCHWCMPGALVGMKLPNERIV
jgi:hypothetical protein